VRGIFLHPTLAITPNRECLGIVDYEQWSREKFTNQTSEERKTHVFTKQITLPPPREKAKDGLKPVQVTAIIATETNPPAGEKAIEWTLLTSIPVFDLEASLQIIQWYLCRWQIEIYFKSLKSGCNIEKLQLSDKQRFDPCLAMYLITAWRILFLTMLGRASPSLSNDR